MQLRTLILQKIQELGEASLDVLFPRRYPEARLWREILGLDRRRRFSRRSFSTLLSQLRSQGLVARAESRRTARWRLTARGRAYLEERRSADHQRDWRSVRRLVIFDIPERERHKRDAIRAELIAAGYTLLQKSVWAGATPLPENFVALLDALGLGDKVHIFSVQNPGTLAVSR